MHRFILILLLVSFSLTAFTQQYIGVDVGFRNSNNTSYSKLRQYGLNYEIKYPSEKAAIYIGALYEFRNKSNNERYTEYAKTTFGFDFNFGKRFYYIIGIGLSGKLLMTNNNYYYDPKRVVLGGVLNTGFGYGISERILFYVLAQYQFDITPSDEYVRPDHFGGDTNEPIREQVLFFQFSIRFLLKK